MSFTHLQVRSGYSFHESTITMEKLVARAAKLDFGALAITDVEVMHGVIPFYEQCMAAGIKPIIGMVVHVVHDEADISLVLLAENNVGYENLMKIATDIQVAEGCSFATFAGLAEGVICLIHASNDFVQEVAEGYGTEKFYHLFDMFMEVFTAQNVFVGVGPGELEVVRELDVPAMALADVRYLEEPDYVAFDCLQAMKRGENWERSSINEASKGRHLASTPEMELAFSSWPALVTETEKIAARCEVTIRLGEFRLPTFPVPTAEGAHAYLTRTCEEMLVKKYLEVSREARERLAYELDVIARLGFSDYFLIVADFVAYAKENDILVGPGRGSSASSLVAHLLGITTIDPLEYHLLFERFLNPERVTMPDIDVDFASGRRDEVIDYIREKYGRNNVAQVVTYGRFAARSLLRDLMKTMDIDSNDQAYIYKNVPKNTQQKLLTYVEASEDFAAYIKQTPKIRTLFSIALKLEGLPRHASTHAAGVVIGTGDLRKNVPLAKGSAETYVTQYAMDELEAVGLLKFDILALRNLATIDAIVKSVKRSTGRALDLNNIPFDDEATYSLLQKGKTNGVFQLESPGMKRVLTQLRPTTFDDIVVLNALYRPGPMEFIPDYIARQHGEAKVTYIHPDLEVFLHATNGVLIYQEQIMQIANHFAGFTLGEADVLRRAVGEKERQLMEDMRTQFITGCVTNGYVKQVAEEIFSWIVKFADYGFPKSHSVVYSKLGYQLSYLKANYPHAFFTTIFGTIGNDASKLASYIREARELGIRLLPPSINHSYGTFSIEGNQIRMGLLSIRGVGMDVIREIVRVRKNGEFKDLFDFCMRVRAVKRNVLELLILAGTFDSMYANRASLLASIHQAEERADLFGDMDGQGSLFGDTVKMTAAYTEIADFSVMKKLTDELELLGMYVSEHPLGRFRGELAEQGYVTLGQAHGFDNHVKVRTAAIVQEIRKINTKRGDSMAFVALTDESDVMDAVIFPALYREVNRWLEEESIVYLDGKISVHQGKKQIALDRMTLVDLDKLVELEEQPKGKVYVRVNDMADLNVLADLRKFAIAHPGNAEVFVYDEAKKQTYKLEKSYAVSANETCLLNMMGRFGAKDVVYKT